MQKQNIHYKWRGKKILQPFDGNNPSRYNEIRIKKDNENISSWIAVKKKSLLTIFLNKSHTAALHRFQTDSPLAFYSVYFTRSRGDRA